MQELPGASGPLAIALDPPADFSGFSQFPTFTHVVYLPNKKVKQVAVKLISVGESEWILFNLSTN